MKVVSGWLKGELSYICSTLIMAGLLLLCTYLYGESMRPALLTLWMCGFFLLCRGMVSFYSYWKKSTALDKTL